MLVAIAVAPSAAVAAVSPASPGYSLNQQSRVVASLRQERADLRARLQAHESRLDSTRARMSEMTFELGRVRGDYERTYADFVNGLVTMYKQPDRLHLTEFVIDAGLDQVLPEYEFYSRLATEQQRTVEELMFQQSRIELLQGDIADLKSLRIQEESSLRARLADVEEALATGVSDLKAARELSLEATPAPASSHATATIPQPGIGGFLVGANHPPADYAPSGFTFAGLASWYGPGFQGNHTANGEIYNMYGFTCASRTLPFNTWLRLTYRSRSAFVRVNDRGPMSPDRILDLSYGAATALGFSGVARVEAEIWAP
jgi:hypothetical protein